MKNKIPENKDKNSRRKFIRNSSLAFAAIHIIPRHVLGRGFTAPSDRIGLGFIGLGKQSRGLSSSFAKSQDVEIIAGSDVWKTKNDWFKNHVKYQYADRANSSSLGNIQTYLNYKELLERKDIDAVVIATPDHWHGIQSVEAMKAGKDIYCEKPLTHIIKEGREIVDTANKTNRIVQTGSMQRSSNNFRKACELVRNGYLGEIKKVLVNVGDPARPYDLPKETTPNEINWEDWCGPAPLLAYNHRLAPSRNDVDFWPDWRLFEEVGGGILSDWGAHMFDIAQWGLGMDHSGPVEYIPPTNPAAVRGLKMYYDNGIEMVHEDFGRGWGVRFIGNNGTLDISRSYLDSTPANLSLTSIKKSDIHLYDSSNHHQDWLNAIKNRTQPICNAETGHRSATICNIANIAYNLKHPLKWDPKKEKFQGDRQANKMRKRVHKKA
ncbi:Predicted dehydrogenase [Salegentibacter agarivorans]|uniref:Predicted dehydrogenase n=1 Tax=Salegentibacter agarivorans TaxID=345907 RepID=A0A1I2KMP0_9FLAO|nr:Gfo/Idh/MocA family oxidoreductase [Salegentibacter agarivorans]SFF68225.1 Predicted dehydrogenase [Salegentibacter agarivorans]